jgi:PAS domain S-box-containing protein
MNIFFNLGFHNKIGFAIAFIPAVINFILIFYVLFSLPRNKLVNLFALFILSALLWQADDVMARMSNSAQTADAWDSLLSAGWTFLGCFGLHFSLLYSRLLSSNKSRIAIILIYTPAIIFASLYQLHIYRHIFIYDHLWGWISNYGSSAIIITQLYWMAAMITGTAIILFYYTCKIRKNAILFHQSLLITIGIAVPAIGGIITQVIIPTASSHHAIPITSTLMTFFSLATVQALRKYKLFRLSELVDNEMFIEFLPVIICSVAENKQISYINSFGKLTLGITNESEYHKPFDQYFHFGSAQDIQHLTEAWSNALNGFSTHFVESSFITPKGEINLLFSADSIVNNNQVQGVLFVARDITELKKSEKLLLHKEYLLNEAQELSHIGSWEWDISTNQITWSDELYRIYGYAPNEFPVSYEWFLKNVHPKEQKKIQEILETAMAKNQSFSFYYHIVRPDQTEATIYAKGSVATNENKEVTRMNGTAQDVTEQKNQEALLQNQNEELKKINTELDRFVYSVSHDLRAPLTSMLGIINITQDDTSDPQTLKHLEMLKASISRLDKFILDILDYSRNSRMNIQSEAVNWQELIDIIIENMGGVQSLPIKVSHSIQNEEGITFFSDKNRLLIILNNLLSNAIRYRNTSIADPFVEINISIARTGSIIEVKDNGVGIRKEQQEKIFDMFYRASKNTEGSGLGLYIVKETVHTLKGEIKVQSVAGKGTTFKANIPNMQDQNLPG